MSHRGTIHLEAALVLAHEACPGDQYLLRLKAPHTARTARAGSFVHLQCDPLLPMRRPLSIMRADPAGGWIELLYRVVGQGTRLLARRAVGEELSLLGPVGRPFHRHPERDRPLLIGGGVGIPPMIFLAQEIHQGEGDCQPLLLAGSETPFPFAPRPSQIMTPALPAEVIAAVPLLEDWGITSRLASLQGFPGCHRGYVTDLARLWLESLDEATLARVEIFACGPHPMLEAAATLARDFGLPCQLSLEEFMACAVGGCAGCVVPVADDEGGIAMKRVCVDGPVFEARQVFPAPPL